MTVATLTLVALALSAVPILALCIGDPKRRRSARAPSGTPAGRRRLLTLAACVPGLACVLSGDAAAFMLWLGGCALIGWLAAACFAERAG